MRAPARTRWGHRYPHHTPRQQPLRLHHPQLLIILPDGHAALVEVEQHADTVALLPRLLPTLPFLVAGEAAPVARVVQATPRSSRPPPSTSQPGRITPNIMSTSCPRLSVNCAEWHPDRIATLLAAARPSPSSFSDSALLIATAPFSVLRQRHIGMRPTEHQRQASPPHASDSASFRA